MKFETKEKPASRSAAPKSPREVRTASPSNAAPTPEEIAIQIERVSRLVFQEVVMIQQSGATSLAVSLKVDSRTELFLQLTHHDGQMTASLRFERGNSARLGGQWEQLQDCLARQEIHLLPLANRLFEPVLNGSGDNALQP
jgi:hypothetical protein